MVVLSSVGTRCPAARASTPPVGILPAGRRSSRRPTSSSAASTIVIARRFSTIAPRATPSDTIASSSPYTDASRTPSPDGREHDQHGDDRADGAGAAEERDRDQLRVAADRAQHEEQREPAERPRQRVEGEQLEGPSRPAAVPPPRRRTGAAARFATAREHRRVEQDGEQDREGEQRQQRRVRAADQRQTDDEHAHAASADSPASSRIVASTTGVSLHAEPAQRDDARRRRPHPARDVLRQHREHLRLQGDGIREPDPVRGRIRIQPSTKTR